MNVAECLASPTATLSFASGTLLTAAWFLFADALVLHSMHDVEPMLSIIYWAPALLAMFAFAMLALAPVNTLVDTYADAFVGGGIDCTRLWVFCSLTMFFGAIIGAVFLAEAMRSTSSSAYAYISSALLDDLARNATTAVNATVSLPAYDDAMGEWYHVYVGYAIVGQASLIFASAGACLFARMHRATADF